MALQNITLTATESNWRLFMVRKADPAFLTFQEKIFIRDDYACQFCGFKSKKFQDVVNLDGNYLNNRKENLVTSCCFCSQCFFLEAIGKSDFGGGILIYLPEMSQAELNALCHVLFGSMVVGNSYSGDAKNIYRCLKLRSQPVEQVLGAGFSNPALFGQMLVDSQVENAHAFQSELSQDLRVLPNMARFVKEMREWAHEGVDLLEQI